MPSESLLIGRTIAGRYRITGLIGQGGMAAVYRGAQDGDPPEVAIKVMNEQLARDKSFVKRFAREAKAASRLKHRSTVRIFDYGVEHGLPYIVMELLEGAELVKILEHERRLPEARAARIMAQVCSALAAAHDLGIVHRDLKPENIMLWRDPTEPNVERVKVLDFGIAKILDPEMRPPDALPVDSDDPPPSSESKLTLAGTLVGTPEYMSPEQSRGNAIDARSDVYTCGILLYQLITGRVPFSGDTYFETALLHVHRDPQPPHVFAASIHPKLEALILKALAKMPGDRPQSAREMQEQLLEVLPELAPARHASMPVPSNTSSAELGMAPTEPLMMRDPVVRPAFPLDADDEQTTTLRRTAEMHAAEEPDDSAVTQRPEAPGGREPPAPRAPPMEGRSGFLTPATALAAGVGIGMLIVFISALAMMFFR